MGKVKPYPGMPDFNLEKDSVSDPHRFYADPDPAFLLNADPDPDPTCRI
jgi:hypothetical protein